MTIGQREVSLASMVTGLVLAVYGIRAYGRARFEAGRASEGERWERVYDRLTADIATGLDAIGAEMDSQSDSREES